ncbi:two-component sensor histidine kinase [Paenibacillus sp. VTT E-133280]|uniref:sensor histidine kinase n=1 Tax=unclassified Paenibacillus TaxID=185978 RepID=UPI000B9FAADE|nr:MULTISPECIES: HAMP domain-containing sensor histidine kinase [unclassified Paenibacillus]MBY3621298.1 HAMP domain-containing protein [Acinetobacter sp. CUI P1]OZQ69025.1 two-component sensor histidine kinase [Paenibacillus sp. VTT E-133280]OZQ97533.1 two-component sensor histidine kinase [Paenibacillus sp. VTT E-133291]
MRKIKLNSIPLKLGSVLVIMFMVLLFCIESVLYMLFIRFYTDDVLNEQIHRNQSYAAVLSEHFDMTTINHVLLTESKTDNLLLILDRDNALLGSSEGTASLPPEYLQGIIIHGTSADFHGPVLNSDWKNEPNFVTEADIVSSGETIGRVFMFSPTVPIQTAIKTLNNTFIGVAAVVLVLSALIILLVSRKLVQPLLRMIKITKRISEGIYDWKLEPRGSDEIAQLSHAINRMSSNIQHYEQQRRQFLADISHELRTPLTYMKGYSEVLKNGLVQNQEDQERYLQLLYTQSIQLQRLVQDLFELANMEQGSFKLVIDRTSVDKVMQNALELMSDSIQQHGIELDYQPSSSPVYVKGDERRLQQVVINLLENARKYTPSGGRITVSTSTSNGQAVIMVKDTGIGIPADELPHIWQRLYRVEKSRSRTTGGTGLGLAISREIVMLHQGQITVDSTEGSGTTFKVLIPLIS